MLGEALCQLDIKAVAGTGHEIGIADAEVTQFAAGLYVLQIGSPEVAAQADQ